MKKDPSPKITNNSNQSDITLHQLLTYIKNNELDKALELFNDEKFELINKNIEAKLFEDGIYEFGYGNKIPNDNIKDIINEIRNSKIDYNRKITFLDNILYNSKVKFMTFETAMAIKEIYNNDDQFKQFIKYINIRYNNINFDFIYYTFENKLESIVLVPGEEVREFIIGNPIKKIGIYPNSNNSITK